MVMRTKLNVLESERAAGRDPNLSAFLRFWFLFLARYEVHSMRLVIMYIVYIKANSLWLGKVWKVIQLV